MVYAPLSDKYYVGYTSDISLRLHQHNFSERLTFTSKHRPWILKALFNCGDSEAMAVKIERHIKKQKSRKFIEQIINSNILQTRFTQLVRVPNARD